MPFSPVFFPSLALGLLKSLLRREEIPCQVEYFNIAFRSSLPEMQWYDKIADYWFLGEWVFGEALFGAEWARSGRGGEHYLYTLEQLPPDEHQEVLEVLPLVRNHASCFINQCLDKIEVEQYDIIGFTSVYSQQIASLALASRIKERRPETIIAFGGPNCDLPMGESFLRLFPAIDWVFSGDADRSFPEAVKRQYAGKNLHGIKGLIFREGDKIIKGDSSFFDNLESLPYPEYDDYFSFLQEKVPDLIAQCILPLEFSRGCWWGQKKQCVFCGVCRDSLHYRYKSPQRCEDEIATLTRRYGCTKVHAVDANIPHGFFKSLLPSLGQKKILHSLFVETRTTLSRQELEILNTAGSTYFQPGIESLDSAILRHMHKGTTLFHNIRLLKWCRELGMKPVWNFLYGFPGEDRGAYKRMAALIPFLEHLLPPPNICTVILQRFSPLYEQQDHWPWKSVQLCHVMRHFYPFPDEDLEKLAYTYSYTSEEKECGYDYAQQAIEALEKWKKNWQTGEPPLLAYEQTSPESLTIYDTRTARRFSHTKISGDLALAYLACDAGTSIKNIIQSISKLRKNNTSPDERLLLTKLHNLVEDGLMIEENGRFLSLANNIALLSTKGNSLLAKMLTGNF